MTIYSTTCRAKDLRTTVMVVYHTGSSRKWNVVDVRIKICSIPISSVNMHCFAGTNLESTGRGHKVEERREEYVQAHTFLCISLE